MTPADPTTPTEPRDAAPSAAWARVFAAWCVAAAATLGALFMSEVLGHAPCVLCWWQRICMFPLVVVLGVGLFPFDARVVRYALPLAVAGWAVAVFHLLLVEGVVPESASPCVQGVPCAEVQVEWFGFVTIPLLSTAAFTIIAALLLLTWPKKPP